MSAGFEADVLYDQGLFGDPVGSTPVTARSVQQC